MITASLWFNSTSDGYLSVFSGLRSCSVGPNLNEIDYILNTYANFLVSMISHWFSQYFLIRSMIEAIFFFKNTHCRSLWLYHLVLDNWEVLMAELVFSENQDFSDQHNYLKNLTRKMVISYTKNGNYFGKWCILVSWPSWYYGKQHVFLFMYNDTMCSF